MRYHCISVTCSLGNSILLRSYFVVVRLTVVGVRDTTAATACCTRHEHVSTINNNIMSYMVLYYCSYRNRAAFKFVSKIEMRLRLLYYTELMSVYILVPSYYGATTWRIYARNVLPVSSVYRKAIFSLRTSFSSTPSVFFFHAFSRLRLI